MMQSFLSRLSLLRRISLLVLSGFWLVLLALGFLLYSQAQKRFEEQAYERLAADIIKFEGQIARTSQESFEIASLFSGMNEVLAAYATAAPGDAAPSDDNPHFTAAREHLKVALADVVQGWNQNNDSRFSLHFHMANLRSLWRVWNNGQSRSDDLSGFRETLVAMQRPPHRPVLGIEVGVGGFGIRGIAPVLDKNSQFVGTVEYLGDFNAVFEALVTDENQNALLLMDRSQLAIATALQDESKNPGMGSDHVVVAVTDRGFYLGDAFREAFVNEVKRGSSSRFRAGDYILMSHPIRDFSGEEAGVLVTGLSANELVAMQRGFAMMLVTAGVLGSLIFIAILMLVQHTLRKVSAISGNLTQSSFSIRETASEVSNASQTLAEGASEQAASLEQTSSSMEHLTQMVSRNTELSKQTAAEAKEVGKSAQLGVSLMDVLKGEVDAVNAATSDMNSAMEQIRKSSDSVSMIIRTIDEIAFQTNILALNAAVEAARAGEAGAGFAVVADEVRALARRAAEAARETTQLIDQSINSSRLAGEVNQVVGEKVSQVLEGARKVETELLEIAGRVKSMDKSMGELDGSAQEQLEGIEQINQAVLQLNEVTQSNAANAEEAASASQIMDEQASNLKQLAAALDQLIEGGSNPARISG